MKTSLFSPSAKAVLLVAAALTAPLSTSIAEPPPAPPAATITVEADKPGIRVSPTLYGIFFEEINRAGDGGIYAEMVQNRSFEDDSTPVAWSPIDGTKIALDTASPITPINPTSLRVEAGGSGGRTGVVNNGFKGAPQRPKDKPEEWRPGFQKAAAESRSGIAVETGKTYRFSLYARGAKGFAGPLSVAIEKQDGTVLASKCTEGIGEDWKKLTGELTTKATDSDARLVISTTRPGTFWIDMVSLFPNDTFKGRANGMRRDLGEMLAAMSPAFVRFPGGCFVEGNTMVDATRWKDTIGDPAERPGHYNLWGYRSSDGLGFHEYLQLCEDLGAEPLFVINVGMSHREIVPMDKMPEFVKDALDAIEYANGPIDSEWGALRAKAGHPKPFGLKFIEIGNENGGPEYHARYALFHDAIKAKYPDVQLIACHWSGGVPKNRPLDLIDEHYYSTPEFFAQQAARYDSYDRKGPKIYIGEFAVTQGPGAGKLAAALGEAAFMTGMERNADIVAMGSYAPLFERDGWATWHPNAIVFDSSRAFGIPSYHAQAMFAANRADVALPTTVTSPIEPQPFSGRFGVGTWAGTVAEFKDIKVTRDGKTIFESDFSKNLGGLKAEKGPWKVENAVLVQTGPGKEPEARALAGGSDWRDYTLSLKARKLSGPEGFLILFGWQKNKSWWNLGGWGNSEHGIECPGVSTDNIPGSIETGRWYDIRVELSGPTVKCYLDGKLVQEATRKGIPSLFATAGHQESTGELILKVVNMAPTPTTTSISLNGLPSPAPEAKATVLTSPDPLDGNSFDEPDKVSPKTSTLDGIAPHFTHAFPPNSITVLRIKSDTEKK